MASRVVKKEEKIGKSKDFRGKSKGGLTLEARAGSSQHSFDPCSMGHN